MLTETRFRRALANPLLRRLAETLAVSAVIAAFSLLGSIVLARTLGPVGRGELALLLLWPQVVSTISNLGIDLASTYFSGDERRRGNVPATGITVAVCQSLLAVPLYLALIPVLFRSVELGALPYLVAVLIPVDLVALYLTCALNGRHDYTLFNTARLAMAPAYALATVALAALGMLTVGSAMVAFVAANALIAGLALVFTVRRHGLGSCDRALVADSLRFGIRSHLGRLSPQSLGVDLVVVALVLSVGDLGLFAAAVSFLGLSRLLAASVGVVLFPESRAAQLAGRSARAIRATIIATVAISAAGAGLLWIVGRPLAATLFGDAFRDAGTIAAILATGEIARSGYLLVLDVLRGYGRPTLTSVAELSNWALFLLAVAAAAQVGGLIAISTGVAAASAASLAMLLALARRTGALTWLVDRDPAVTSGGARA